MARSSISVACALAAAAALALLSSSAFTVGGGAARARLSAPQRSLRSSTPQAAPQAGSWQDATCTALAAGLAIGLAAAARRSLALRAVAEPETKALSGSFAGGLTGSEYHGWGKYEFDPAGFAVRYPEHLPWYREAELKHGRVAMLACLGLVVPDFVRLPLDILENKDLDLVNAHNKLIGPGLGEGPMWWLLIFCSLVESNRFRQVGLAFEKLTLENAGDLEFGKAFLPKTEEGIKQLKIKELKNGRLAMLAFSGAITQAVAWNAHHFPFVPGS